MDAFIAALSNEHDVAVLGRINGDIVLMHKPSKRAVAVPVSELQRAGPQEVARLVRGQRELRILRHVTRIVGYYSLMHNWNASKLAEHAARTHGQYAVPEPPSRTARRVS